MNRLADRVFAALIRVLPASFGADDAANLRELFEARAKGARARSGVRRAVFYTRELASMIALVGSERWRGRRAAPIFAGASRDLAQAIRRLAQARGFTATVILTLALAIGASAATFTVFYRLAVAPLPYPYANRLVAIDHDAPGTGLSSIGLSLGLYWEYARLPSTHSIALYYRGEQTISGDGDADRVPFLHTTASLGDVLSIRASVGRWFTAEEGRTGARPVVFLSHELWRRRFGGSPDVVGAVIRLDGVAHTIVGVAEPGFAFPDPAIQYAVPLRLNPQIRRVDGFNYAGVARLAPGVALATARAEQNQVIADIPQRFADQMSASSGLLAEGRITSAVTPLADRIVGDAGRMLWLLGAGALAMLVIAGANVANLLLVRTNSRQHELAIRRALGASRRALARATVAEVAVLSLAAGALGIALTNVALKLLVDAPAVAWPRGNEIAFDGAAVTIAVGVTLALAIVIGTAQLFGSRLKTLPAITAAGRGNTETRRASRLRCGLLTGQVAMALVLLVTAGLLGRSADRLHDTDPGFTPEGRLAFDVGLPRATYRNSAAASAFNANLLARLRQLPGVRGAALVSTLPLDGPGQTNPLEVEGNPAASRLGISTGERIVSPGYFSVIGIPVKRGRVFDERDLSAPDPVVIVDETLARAYFRGDEPIGRRIRASGETEWRTIVGVVGRTPTVSLRAKAGGGLFYVPDTRVLQSSVVIDAAVPPASLVPAVRQHLAAVDRSVALARPRLLTDVIANSNADMSVLTGAFGLAALASVLLGAVGVYGVVANLVAARSPEIGIRLALGAQATGAIRLVVGQAALAVASGIAIGVALCLAMRAWIQSWMFEISAADWPTYIAATTILALAAAAACWPARRAAAINPLSAMRSQ